MAAMCELDRLGVLADVVLPHKKKQGGARTNKDNARENEDEHEQSVDDGTVFTHVRRQPMVGGKCERTATKTGGPDSSIALERPIDASGYFFFSAC